MSISSRGPYGYSKMEKEDPEEASHRRAQFLIYKALERADCESAQARRPSFLRIRFCRLKMRVGKRLKRMRKGMLLTLSQSGVGAYKQKIVKQIKRSCMRLFRLGESTKPSIPHLLI
ncbi:hypothetical protein EUGRSUZ_D01311 [Eucalyptus grandis]|uniref:Uncharacterized protein n=2 Tax=Eucalyptus grandis TaxID=71139 RepID=A0ACC3L5Y9_EUCGR|nr:hypothetical protein EUGRSUZ_D01311 [Eucalyptus grandis]